MVKLLKAALVWTLAFAMVVQPMLANAQNIQVVGSDNGPRPRVDQSHNDTTVLNISTPNTAGVSHDIYTEFEANDVIVNNSPTNVDTQLGGWIEGNPNLVPGLNATTWIGEVVGGSQTTLNGILEVAGPTLDVVLANEFGITCNGCGFVNTSRTTLTTGKPIFRTNGSLSGFDVTRGLVTVGPNGLNPEDRLALSDTTRVDVISRAAAIYGKMRADQLNVVAGANVVNYDWSYNPDTGEISGVTPQEGVGAAPALAVDVSVLGGMYANAIQMVATENGVGVRLHGEMVSNRNISLSANGRLSLGAPSGTTNHVPKIKAKKKVRIRNKGPLLLEGSIISEDNDLIDIQTSEGSLTMSGEVLGGAVTLQSAGQTNVSALIEAQNELKIASLEDSVTVESEGQFTAASLQVDAAKAIHFDGTAAIAGLSTLTATEDLATGAASTIDGQSVSLQGEKILTQGNIIASAVVDILAGSDGSKNTGKIEGDKINLSSEATIEQDGQLNAEQTISMIADGSLTMGAESKTYSTDITVKAADATLNGALKADAALNVETLVGGITTFGTLSAQNLDFVSKTTLTNNGTVSAGNILNITVETTFTNTATLIAGNKLNIYADQIINDSAVIWSNGDVTLAGNSALDPASLVQNSNGRIEAFQGDLIIRASELHNVGTAPTLSESEIIKWVESADAEPVDPVDQLSNLIDDAFLDADGNILPAYASQYTALWADLINGADTLSAESKSILSAAVLSPSGTSLKDDFKGVWEDMYGRANAAGTTDPAAQVAAMVDPAIFDDDGNVLPEFATAYSDLWVALASGQTTVSDGVKEILVEAALVDPEGNELATDNTDTWATMTAGSGVGYDIINVLYQDRLNDDGKLAELIAGGGIDIIADKVYNTYGNVSAGTDISIVADEIHNKALGASQVLFQVKKKPGCFTCHTGEVDFYDSFGGRIEAVGNISISGNLTNETEESSELGMEDVITLMNEYIAEKQAENDPDLAGVPDVAHNNFHFEEHRDDDFINPVEGGGDDIREIEGQNTGATTAINTGDPATIAATSISNPTPTPSVDELLVAGLNTIAETNPEFTEYANYITSNYMMEVDRLQYRDDLLLNTTDQTGHLRAAPRTPSQPFGLAYLDKEIAVPVPGSTTGEVNIIYPAAQQLEVTPVGALIKGQDITVEGDLDNSGNIIASRNTSITSDNITSTRGQISADTGTLTLSSLGDMDLERTTLDANAINIVAGQDFVGKGVTIKSDGNTDIFASGSATLTSFETTAEYKWANGDVSSVSHLTSSLETGGDLSIVSMADVVLAGVDGDIGGNATFSALANLTFDAVANEQTVTSGNSKKGEDHYDLESIATTLTVGGNTSATAIAGTLTMVGTQVDTGGTLDLSASEVVLAASQNIETHETRKSKKSFITTRQTTKSTTSVINQGVMLASGDDLTVTSTIGDIKTAGTDFISNSGDITINAAGDVLAGTYTDVFTSNTTKKKSTFFGLISSESRTSTTDQYATGTDALAALDLSLVSGTDMALIGTTLSAGQNLTVESGGALDIAAAISSERFEHFSHDMGLVLMTTIQENSFQEFAALSQFLADGEINFTVDGTTALTLYHQPGEDPVDPSTLYPDELLALQGLELLNQELADDYFYDEQTSLSPAFKALLAVVVTNFILPGIGFTSFLSNTFAQSALGSFLVPGIEAFASTLIVESIDQAVGGDFDIGAVLEGAVFSGVSAGLAGGINLDTFIGEIAQNSPITQNIFGPTFGSANGLTIQNILNGAIDGIITSGLSSAVYGTDFLDSLSSSLVSTVINLTVADVHTEIGDTIKAMGLSEGSAPHAILHALAGCAAGAASAAAGDGNAGNGCASGASAGLISSVMARYYATNPVSVNENLTAEEKQAFILKKEQDITSILAAAGGFWFSGGDGAIVSNASSIGASAIANNRQLHINEEKIIARYAKDFALEMGWCDDDGTCFEGDIARAKARLTQRALARIDAWHNLGLGQYRHDEADAFLKKIAAKEGGWVPDTNQTQTLFLEPPGTPNYQNSYLNASMLAQTYDSYDLINAYLTPGSSPLHSAIYFMAYESSPEKFKGAEAELATLRQSIATMSKSELTQFLTVAVEGAAEALADGDGFALMAKMAEANPHFEVAINAIPPQPTGAEIAIYTSELAKKKLAGESLTSQEKEFLAMFPNLASMGIATRSRLGLRRLRLLYKRALNATNSATIGGKTCVYSCVVDGTTRYVGITNDVARRGSEHLRTKGIKIAEIRGLSNLSVADAKSVEQTLINYYGLGKNGGTLLNKINSISPVKIPTAYEKSLIRGKELLDSVNYQWTN